MFESFLAALLIERGKNLLYIFLCLTVLNKSEFRNKFPT